MRTASAAIYCGLLTATVGCPGSSHGQETALDRYVAAPDPSYHYNLINTVAGDGYTGYVLEMTSQKWRTPEEVDRPIWTHWLTIVRPEHSVTSTSLLLVSGGSNEKPPPQLNPILTQLALTTNSVISELRMVPNQPLVFTGDGAKRTEDAITAYSWQKFLTTGDETWPVRLPMTKSRGAGDGYHLIFLWEPGGRWRPGKQICGRRRLEARLDGVDCGCRR